MSNSKVLIIWGMHRSGTSMLASWLRACGLDVGSELLGEGVGNERGHYEDMDFLRLHERILRANGIDCGGLLKTAPLQIPADMQLEMRELVARKCQSPQWGWKEPRTCLFSREYHELLPDAFGLIVFRDYALVVDSLLRRKLKKQQRRLAGKSALKRAFYRLRSALWLELRMKSDANRYLAAWIHYNENLLRWVEQNPGRSLVLDCNELLVRGPEVMQQLQVWGFQLQPVPVEQYREEGMIANKASMEHGCDPALLAHAAAVQRRLQALAQSAR